MTWGLCLLFLGEHITAHLSHKAKNQWLICCLNGSKKLYRIYSVYEMLLHAIQKQHFKVSAYIFFPELAFFSPWWLVHNFTGSWKTTANHSVVVRISKTYFSSWIWRGCILLPAVCHGVKQQHQRQWSAAFYCREDIEAADKNNNNSPSISSSSSSSLCPLISMSHLNIVVFVKNPWEDLYSRWGPGRCFLNIYEPLDRGSWVLDCCPRCPLAEREWAWAPASNPHYASLPPSDSQGTGA